MKLDADFHKWAFSKKLRVEIIDGRYTDLRTEMFFECWQAARCAALSEAITICNDYSTGRRTIPPDIPLENMGEIQKMIMHSTAQSIAYDVDAARQE